MDGARNVTATFQPIVTLSVEVYTEGVPCDSGPDCYHGPDPSHPTPGFNWVGAIGSIEVASTGAVCEATASDHGYKFCRYELELTEPTFLEVNALSSGDQQFWMWVPTDPAYGKCGSQGQHCESTLYPNDGVVDIHAHFQRTT